MRPLFSFDAYGTIALIKCNTNDESQLLTKGTIETRCIQSIELVFRTNLSFRLGITMDTEVQNAYLLVTSLHVGANPKIELADWYESQGETDLAALARIEVLLATNSQTDAEIGLLRSQATELRKKLIFKELASIVTKYRTNVFTLLQRMELVADQIHTMREEHIVELETIAFA